MFSLLIFLKRSITNFQDVLLLMEAQALLSLWYCWLFASSLNVALKVLILCV